MCQFPLFETISIVEGELQHISFHQQRYEYALKHYFNVEPKLNLAQQIIVPENFKKGKVRCRIDYNASAMEIRFYAYQARNIRHFKLAFCDQLDYQFKYSDRKALEKLKQPDCDETIIIQRGFVTDCTIGNLLFLKNNRWYSPTYYLLKGTQLSYLLEQGKVDLAEIRLEDLANYEKVMMINALNPFDLARALPISAIDLYGIM